MSLKTHGPIAWMAENHVAANLLMLICLVGGLIFTFDIKQEVFPEFDIDFVMVKIAYPGASPEEVERGIITAVEEEIRSLEGIKRVTSSAGEGSALVMIELLTDTNKNKALQDVKGGVDRITSFPQDSERPVVSLLSMRKHVLALILYGDLEESILRKLAEDTREELLQKEKISYVSLIGVRPPEISIEVPHSTLRAHNLTLTDISKQVAATAVELPAGGVKTRQGEVLLRTDERRDYASEFSDIPILSRKDGSRVVLSDIADIRDTFRDVDKKAFFNGQPAVSLVVYRVGDQTPIEISEIVNEFKDELQERLPDGIGVSTWDDRSEVYSDRLNLLLKNAAVGLILVLCILGTFLSTRLAFWVTLGIPISFLGAFLLMPIFGVSINMISLFAFIVTLGIVVDDAIVVGENIFELRQEGYSYLEASIKGARMVAVPVTFAILTNLVTFAPLLFLPGVMGKIFKVIPLIVFAVFIISWIESLFILPAHLAWEKKREVRGDKKSCLQRHQERFSKLLSVFIADYYTPFCKRCLNHRYITLTVAVAILLSTFGLIKGGHINFVFFPKVDGDIIIARAELPYGSPVEETETLALRLYDSATETIQEFGGADLSRGVLVQVGSQAAKKGPARGSEASGGHTLSVSVFLASSDTRGFRAKTFEEVWRKKTGEVTEVENLSFDATFGPSGGDDINIELGHTDLKVLEEAAAKLAGHIGQYNGVIDINDGFETGKPQLSFKLKEKARSLGITAASLASQVRSAFYGARAFRQQRGRDEIWVMVRLPENERKSEYNIEKLMIRTPAGGEIPLMEAAEVIRGRAYTVIKRAEGRRVVNVSASVEEGKANPGKILAEVKRDVLPELMAHYPGLSYSMEGAQREQRETLESMIKGFLLALFIVFSMLAIPFKSYLQPAIVMTAIPFGVIGAVFGHMLMGYSFNIISVMGVVALSGVVVNDSLVLVHYANELRDSGEDYYSAILKAGQRRFRPIVLTSFTTFFGLAPMILETSVQARFLVPMAISLGFGVLFATVIALLLVPSLYLILDDLKGIAKGGIR